MTHLSSINALASDIAKLSKTLTTLASEIESALTQEDATEAAAAKQSAKKAAQTKETPKKAETTGEVDSSETSTEATKNPVTIEQVRAVMAEKSQAGLTAQVKALLESFGAAKLSAVNPEDYEALLEAAKEIK